MTAHGQGRGGVSDAALLGLVFASASGSRTKRPFPFRELVQGRGFETGDHLGREQLDDRLVQGRAEAREVSPRVLSLLMFLVFADAIIQGGHLPLEALALGDPRRVAPQGGHALLRLQCH